MKYPFTLLLLLTTFNAWSQSGKPVIVGQIPLSTNEEYALTIRLTDLRVEDRDNPWYPWGFTLTVYPGDNYTLFGTSVTPALNFTGTLSVPVTVNDGTQDSAPYNVQITVTPVNDAPVITAQGELKTIENKALTLKFSDLTVSDPDNSYPTGFTLFVNPGNNYTVSGTTITPNMGFTGTLNIPVHVNDGQVNSAPFTLKVTVEIGNKRPVITGQTPLSTPMNKPFKIQLSHLKVEDPDNVYPADFTLTIHPGSNYTVSGNEVTPTSGFTGTLLVSVAVSDGNTTSEPYNFRVEVKDVLQITGQKPLETNEDERITIELNDLTVYDPHNQFPSGYAIKIGEGENFTAKGATVEPLLHFTGTLSVPITVGNGTYTSPVYALQITVIPINDVPEFVNFPTNELRYRIEDGAVKVLNEVPVIDVDDTHLVLAEIGFLQAGYQPGHDILSVESTPSAQAVFDQQQGILSLIGHATVAEYQTMIQAVDYNFIVPEAEVVSNKTLYFKLSDGKGVSTTYERKIHISENIELDIPNTFTPNNDMANDTWHVRLLRPSDRYDKAIVRVFNKRGTMVFETVGFEHEWDGRYNGEYLPPGTYYYTIDFGLNLSSSKNIKGVVTILR